MHFTFCEEKVSHACLAVTMYAMLAQHLPHHIHQPASTYLPCQSQRTSVSLAACSHAVLAYYASMAGDGIIHLASSMTRSELPEDLALPQKLCCSLTHTGMWKSSHRYRQIQGSDMMKRLTTSRPGAIFPWAQIWSGKVKPHKENLPCLKPQNIAPALTPSPENINT